jgi:hypothetical protein
MRLNFIGFYLVLAMGAVSARAQLPEVSVTPPPSGMKIDSMVAQGTNLVFTATVPPNLIQVTVEVRADMNAQWQEAAMLDAPGAGGEISFTLPKPSTLTAFFRLKASQSQGAATEPQLVSPESEYVVIPSLATKLTESGEAIFHFKGSIDGSDRIIITHDGATWSHVNWSWPDQAVVVNEMPWNSREKNFLTSTGAVKFLPETFSLDDVKLEVLKGRDLVAVERTNGALIVYLDDTPPGADEYEFRILFRPAYTQPAKPASTAAVLKIIAPIDGSDVLKITQTEATWEHKFYGFPTGAVTLNGIEWWPQAGNVLTNTTTNSFFAAGVVFSSARIVGRKGRDVATMWAEKDALWVSFADNPNGADDYELDIAFGPQDAQAIARQTPN